MVFFQHNHVYVLDESQTNVFLQTKKERCGENGGEGAGKGSEKSGEVVGKDDREDDRGVAILYKNTGRESEQWNGRRDRVGGEVGREGSVYESSE